MHLRCVGSTSPMDNVKVQLLQPFEPASDLSLWVPEIPVIMQESHGLYAGQTSAPPGMDDTPG